VSSQLTKYQYVYLLLVSQIDDFVFCRNFNFTNKTCELVELGSINLIYPISTSWHIKFAKLKLLSLGLGCLMTSLG